MVPLPVRSVPGNSPVSTNPGLSANKKLTIRFDDFWMARDSDSICEEDIISGLNAM
jgi:hypothetical protein